VKHQLWRPVGAIVIDPGAMTEDFEILAHRGAVCSEV
jgi:hypothetical protein